MKNQEAIRIVRTVCESVRLTKAEQDQVQLALKTLEDATSEKKVAKKRKSV